MAGIGAWPLPWKVETMTKDILTEYQNRGFSLIPLGKNSKMPIAGRLWKPNQYKRLEMEKIEFWLEEGHNLGIVTGQLSGLIALDIDDVSKVPELQEICPEINHTTRVNTRRAFHPYFHTKTLVSSKRKFNGISGIELKAEGTFVVCPESKVNNHQYEFEIPLGEILPFPERFIVPEPQTIVPHERPETVRRVDLPPFYDKGMLCLSQVLERDFKDGERDKSLFLIYALLRRARNSEDYSKCVIISINENLTDPLPLKELGKVFRKKYNTKCQSIREFFPFVSCDNCRYNEKGRKMLSLQTRFHSKIPGLTSHENRILSIADHFYDFKIPTQTQLRKRFGMDFRTSKKAIAGLKRQGIV